jgi:hypothetical protein
MTYIGRQGLNNSTACRISVGSFYGHRFLSTSQIYNAYPSVSIDQLQTTTSLKHLCQLSEDLRCRYQLASTELRQLVNDGINEHTVKQVRRYNAIIYTSIGIS